VRQKDTKLKEKYRILFGSRMGQEVLMDMLSDLHWLDELSADPELIARYNYSRELLKNCMILKEVNKELLMQELFNKSIPDE